MDRDVAIRIDGMVHGILNSALTLHHYMKNNMTNAEFEALRMHAAKTAGEMHELSQSLYAQFPDIVPKELIPPGEG